ncbi:ectonucleotide pyrophosphatase/phosphodiesterase [Chryseobacterium sp. MFBS3-17]|uniref:alkaline phosphatase family protein n=1 Tax=Chryseobacterium sp. MFBS3-17 TaxID=2886689 RepID=UPI001D0DCB60|nr:ectonucleotide pyrophosphatase/phosphodiesterase [Chryseobacterium sp. MFBS3-17]MCC2590673.1 ectonucleotide pyrophosphatase/phosphodiesterase [Chryseobacterium sp. MFBS3-17]
MKKSIVLFLCCVALSAFSQKPVTDTAQVIQPHRKNAPETHAKPYVILISADGFRHDYAEKYGAKNILNIGRSGVSAKSMIPSYPSVTGPNHYSLITGMYPAHHGFVDNYFFDPRRNEMFAMKDLNQNKNKKWLGGIPLWSLAEQQGVLSASLFWVGSNTDAGGTGPTYYYDYHEAFSTDKKIDIVLDWLQLPEEKRPHFITFYFPEVDQNGHRFGAEAPETRAAVKMIDDAVGKLMQKVNALQLPQVNFIFVSDHGMIDADVAHTLKVPELITDKNRFVYINSQTFLRVTVKDKNQIKSVYRELKKQQTKEYKVHLTKRFPRKLNYASRNDRFNRIGDIILVPDSPKIFLEVNRTSPGKHGYDPYRVPEMQATFKASGPAFQEGKVIAPFRNVNLYPIVAEILGLTMTHPIDGKSATARRVLKRK